MDRRKIIFDVDTGTDDAIAIMLALLSKEFEVVGICTVNGNRPVEYTTNNTLRVLDYIGARDIPVYKGCALPMVSTLLKGRRDNVPITEELGDMKNTFYLPLPETDLKERKTPAPVWLIDYLRNAEQKVTIVAVGPLTNLAVALRIEPEIVKNIEEIIIMGGGHFETNCNLSSEFNIWIDPEAAKIVFECGLKITVIPLDATHDACINYKDCDDFDKLDTPAAKATSIFTRMRIDGYNRKETMKEYDSAPIHDALCIAYMLNPNVITDMKEGYCEVAILPGPGDGDTVFDFKYVKRRGLEPNCKVALGADRDLFASILKEKMAFRY